MVPRLRARLGLQRVAFALVLVLVATGLRVGSQTSTGWADTATPVTLNPVADATVSADAPATNLGGDDKLKADNKPRLESYLRFAVPAGATGRATLRLWVLDSTKDGPKIRLYNGTLNETAVTWNNRVTPPVGTAADSGALAARSWAEWDVSGLVAGPGRRDAGASCPTPTTARRSAPGSRTTARSWSSDRNRWWPRSGGGRRPGRGEGAGRQFRDRSRPGRRRRRPAATSSPTSASPWGAFRARSRAPPCGCP